MYIKIWTLYIPEDKILHFIFSFLLTFLFIVLINIIKKKKNKKLNNIGLFFSIFIFLLFLSLFKETWDFFHKGHNVEIKDILTNYIWGYFFFFIYILRKKIKKAK